MIAVQPEFWAYLVLANIAAFIAFGYDKARARAGKWRVAERDLLLLALLGGTLGAYLGRWQFRHKTRKPGFSIALHVTAVVQAGLLAALLIPESWA
ncbi:MAG TPA: DUF1294 domain-containing protein [Sphingobium sp.]